MPTPPDTRRVTIASLATMVAAVAPVHLFGALAPKLQADLGFGDTEQGIAIGIFFAVAAGFAMWGGALTDRFGLGCRSDRHVHRSHDRTRTVRRHC